MIIGCRKEPDRMQRALAARSLLQHSTRDILVVHNDARPRREALDLCKDHITNLEFMRRRHDTTRFYDEAKFSAPLPLVGRVRYTLRMCSAVSQSVVTATRAARHRSLPGSRDPHDPRIRVWQAVGEGAGEGDFFGWRRPTSERAHVYSLIRGRL